MLASADLQWEKESLPLFAPEVREDGSGCDGEQECHHKASLEQKKKEKEFMKSRTT